MPKIFEQYLSDYTSMCSLPFHYECTHLQYHYNRSDMSSNLVHVVQFVLTLIVRD